MEKPTMTAVEIKTIRERMRMTQQEFADHLGTTQTCVSYWESGRRIPRGPAVLMLRKMRDLTREKK